MADESTQSTPSPGLPPSQGAVRLIQNAEGRLVQGQHAALGVNHWLAALLELFGPMAESITFGLNAEAVRGQVNGQLAQGNTGAALDRATLLAEAGQSAARRNKPEVGERDLASVILKAAGYQLLPSLISAAIASGGAKPAPPPPSTPAGTPPAATAQAAGPNAAA